MKRSRLPEFIVKFFRWAAYILDEMFKEPSAIEWLESLKAETKHSLASAQAKLDHATAKYDEARAAYDAAIAQHHESVQSFELRQLSDSVALAKAYPRVMPLPVPEELNKAVERLSFILHQIDIVLNGLSEAAIEKGLAKAPHYTVPYGEGKIEYVEERADFDEPSRLERCVAQRCYAIRQMGLFVCFIVEHEKIRGIWVGVNPPPKDLGFTKFKRIAA